MPRTKLLIVLLACTWVACSDPSSSGTKPKAQNDAGADASMTTGDAGQDQGAPADMAPDQSTPLDMAQDQGQPSDMAQDLGQPGEAITAPQGEWTWVDFPDSRCGNGQPTGIGVNLNDSEDVLIYLQGGGACWDVNTCFVLKSAANLESGYSGTSFAGDGIKNAYAFNRMQPENPFKDASFVYVPYCTGDLHNGDNVKRYMAVGQTRDIHHKGSVNVQEFLKRLGPTFLAKKRIWLTGSSAGAYGAQFNYHRFVAAFPQAEVHLLSDSGPLVQPWGGRYAEMIAPWNFQYPPDCADCDSGFPAWADYLFGTYPNRRFGLLTYHNDAVILLYFNYPADGFAGALSSFLGDHYNGVANAHYFQLTDNKHVLLGGLGALAQPGGGITLRQWVGQWAKGDAAWTSVP